MDSSAWTLPDFAGGVSSSQNPQEPPKDSTVTLDQGTTNTRVCIHEIQAGVTHFVEDDPVLRNRVTPMEKNRHEFPAYVADLDTDKPVVGAEASVLPSKISLKVSGLTLDLTNDDVTGRPRHEILKQFPNGQLLWDLRDDPGFRRQIRKLWVDHFEHIKKFLMSVLRSRNCRMVELVVTLPNWANDEKVYHILMDVIAEVFREIARKDIKWVGEAQAIAHGLVQSVPGQFFGGRSLVLVIDIGGTSLNACLIDIFKGPNGRISVVELGSWGAIGGFENFEMALVDVFHKVLIPAPGFPKSEHAPAIIAAVLKKFKREKFSARPDEPLQYWEGGPNGSHSIDVSADQVKACFEIGFGECVALAKTKIREIAVAHEGDVAVVFTGGSFNNDFLHDDLQTYVAGLQQAHGLPRPVLCQFVCDMHQWPYRESLVAMGAGLAAKASRSTSLASMISNGAVFGLQVWDEAVNGDEWFETATPVFGANVDQDVTAIYPDWGKRGFGVPRFKIICDSFKHTKRPQEPELHFKNCQDVWQFPAADLQRRGRYFVTLEGGTQQDGRPFLIPRLEYHSTSGPRVYDKKGYRLMLYARIGSDCMLVDAQLVQTWDEPLQ